MALKVLGIGLPMLGAAAFAASGWFLLGGAATGPGETTAAAVRALSIAGAAVSALLALLFGGLAVLLHRLARGRAATAAASARFQAASDASLDAFYLLSAVRDGAGEIVDFRFDHCNRRGAVMLAMTPPQIIDQRLLELLPVNHDPRFFARYRGVVETRQPLEDEFFVEIPNVGPLWLQHQVVAVGDGIAINTRDGTQAHALREALQGSEKALRDVTDNVPALIARFDTDQRYTFVNAHIDRVTDRDPASLVGRTLREVLGPAIHDEIAPAVARALAGERFSFDTLDRSGPRTRHYQAHYLPDIDDRGQVIGCYTMTFDVTERREAEQRLAQSQQQLLALINHIPATVGYFDMDQRCLYANDTGLKSQGLEQKDLPGLTLRAAIGESIYAQHVPYLDEVLKGHRARFDGRIDFHGRAAHFQAHLIPDRDEAGLQRGFYLMTFDITALKEAQERQAQVKQRLRAITDNLPVMIAYIDRDERLAFANAHTNAALGMDPAQTLGRPLRELMTADKYEQRRDHLRRALAGERVVFDLESPGAADGRRQWLHTVYIPDVQPDGSVAGLYALTQDVTAQKAIERQLGTLARFDTLTGLANRHHFNEKLGEALARARRDRRAIALMFLDIDHFKRINDTLGHAMGDATLKEFAQRLQQSVRTTDTVARLAGDEFVVILEGLHGPSEPQFVARNILREVNRPFVLDGRALDVTTSLGIAFEAEGVATPTELLARADKALYEAKAGGRNRFQMSVS